MNANIPGFEKFTYVGYIPSPADKPMLVFREGIYIQAYPDMGLTGWYPFWQSTVARNVPRSTYYEYINRDYYEGGAKGWRNDFISGVGSFVIKDANDTRFCVVTPFGRGYAAHFFPKGLVAVKSNSTSSTFDKNYANKILAQGAAGGEHRENYLFGNSGAFVPAADKSEGGHTNLSQGSSELPSVSPEDVIVVENSQTPIDSIKDLTQDSWKVCGVIAAVQASFLNNKGVIKLPQSKYQILYPVVKAFIDLLNSGSQYNDLIADIVSHAKTFASDIKTWKDIHDIFTNDKTMMQEITLWLPAQGMKILCEQQLKLEVLSMQQVNLPLEVNSFSHKNALYGLSVEESRLLYHWVFVDDNMKVYNWGWCGDIASFVEGYPPGLFARKQVVTNIIVLK